jgi:hypothetical protein
MDRQTTQTRLEALYADWKGTLRFSKEEADSLSSPLLLDITEEYCHAYRRVLVLGQETKYWEARRDPADPNPWIFQDICNCSDFLTNSDSIEALCWAYREFKFGARWSRRPFWRAFKEVCAWPDVGMMWSNVVRMDYDDGRSIWNAPEHLRDTLISQQTKLFSEELALLRPHVCLFFSGPNYDRLVKSMLPDCEFMTCGDAPVRELARLIHPALPAASFRTYHPGFLNRAKLWHYIEDIRGLAYNGQAISLAGR